MGGATAVNPPAQLTIPLTQVITATEDDLAWPNTVTGVWADAVSASPSERNTGLVILFEQEGQILGASTSGQSIWRGTLENGILTANYTRADGVGGRVELVLSHDGGVLEGDWESGSDFGSFITYRSFDVQAEQVQQLFDEVFGDTIVFTE